MPLLGLSDEELFPLTNIVLPAWALLLLLPRSRITTVAVNLATLLLCALYSGLMYNLIQDKHSGLDFHKFLTLKGISQMFALSGLVLPGWLHYAAGDLWIGKWVAGDAMRRNMPQIVLIPILVLTMLLAPVGLLAYFFIRGAWAEPNTRKK